MKSLLGFAFIFLAIQSQASLAATQALPQWASNISKKIPNMIRSSAVSNSEMGVWISYHHDEELIPIYLWQDDKLFIPASLTKLVTGAAALKKIDVAHGFKTEVWARGKIKNGVLKGSLILRGLGDPSFTSESMWALVNEFTRSQISRVEGDIIVDDTYFDSVRFDKDRENVRVDRAYDAPVGAMSFNWNSINVYVRPGEKVGEPVKVFADPENQYVRVVNKGVTAKGRVKTIKVSRTDDKGRLGDKITIRGALGINRDEMVKYKSITQPDFWSAYHFREFLRQRSVVVTGKLKKGTVNESGDKLLADFQNQKVSSSVADMMKFSNNYVAEMLTKNLGAIHVKQPGTMKDGLSLIREFLIKDVGIKEKHFSLLNPSGLTRDNQFRPKDIGLLLLNMRNDFTLFPEFLASLPVAGKDGTLKDRMRGTSAESWVRAKTGMLSGVLGLAGYAGRKEGETLSFVFLFNGRHEKMDEAIRLIDRMAVALVK